MAQNSHNMSHIPDNAKKMFTGVIFDVYQWEQELYDGSTATFEMLKRPATCLVIPIVNGKIAVAKQQQPMKGSFVSLLGGRQEPGEDPLESAKRELMEEAGLTSTDWTLFSTTMPYSKVDWTIYIYIAKACTKAAPQAHDAGEKIQVLELSFDEFIDTILSESFCGHELVEAVLRMKLEQKKLLDFRNSLLGDSST